MTDWVWPRLQALSLALPAFLMLHAHFSMNACNIGESAWGWYMCVRAHALMCVYVCACVRVCACACVVGGTTLQEVMPSNSTEICSML